MRFIGQIQHSQDDDEMTNNDDKRTQRTAAISPCASRLSMNSRITSTRCQIKLSRKLVKMFSFCFFGCALSSQTHEIPVCDIYLHRKTIILFAIFFPSRCCLLIYFQRLTVAHNIRLHFSKTHNDEVRALLINFYFKKYSTKQRSDVEICRPTLSILNLNTSSVLLHSQFACYEICSSFYRHREAS